MGESGFLNITIGALRHSTSYGESPGHCDSVLCLCVLGGVGGFGVLSPGDSVHVMLI